VTDKKSTRPKFGTTRSVGAKKVMAGKTRQKKNTLGRERTLKTSGNWIGVGGEKDEGGARQTWGREQMEIY